MKHNEMNAKHEFESFAAHEVWSMASLTFSLGSTPEPFKLCVCVKGIDRCKRVRLFIVESSLDPSRLAHATMEACSVAFSFWLVVTLEILNYASQGFGERWVFFVVDGPPTPWTNTQLISSSLTGKFIEMCARSFGRRLICWTA